MNKRQLIEAIRQINTTAQPRFLEQFQETDLQQYLNNLQSARRHDIRIHSFSRKPKDLRLAS